MPANGPTGEDRRLALLNRLTEVLGEKEAKTLMESLPPFFWNQVATKDDVRASEERLRTEMNAEFANVYAELKAIRTEFCGELKTLRAENTETRGELALLLARQTRTILFSLVGFAITMWGTILAVGLS